MEKDNPDQEEGPRDLLDEQRVLLNKEIMKESPEIFVARMVDVLIDRHKRAVVPTIPRKTVAELVKASGNAEMITAFDRVNELEEEARKVAQLFDDAANEYGFTFGDTTDALIKEARVAEEKAIADAVNEFEFKIRNAIGLVTLVGGKEAYEVLQECREDIKKLGETAE
jgi:hypothetical protein